LALAPEPKWHIRIGTPQLSIKHQSILKRDNRMTNHRAACRTLIGEHSSVESAGSSSADPQNHNADSGVVERVIELDLRAGFL
jgi:hypothetical protein